MKNSLHIFLLSCLLTLSLFAVDAKVKVSVKGDTGIYTSQKVTVAVELMTDAFSITDARIDFPSSSDYIVQAPNSASYLRTVDVNGTDWQVVLYEYEVYALKAGEIKIAPVPISFSASMGYGQPKKAFDLKSKPLHFSVKAPEGFKENVFVLVTDNYGVERKVKPEKTKLIVGDAVTLEVTQKAHNVPDILLKPVHYESNAHLRVYEKEPVLKSGLKGAFDVSRTDRFTFVANAEGNVTLPAQKLFWWNSKTKKAVTETLPEMHFEIIADPQIALDAKREAQKRFLLSVLAGFILLVILYKFVFPGLKPYFVRIKNTVKEKIKKSTRKLDENLNP